MLGPVAWSLIHLDPSHSAMICCRSASVIHLQAENLRLSVQSTESLYGNNEEWPWKKTGDSLHKQSWIETRKQWLQLECAQTSTNNQKRNTCWGSILKQNSRRIHRGAGAVGLRHQVDLNEDLVRVRDCVHKWNMAGNGRQRADNHLALTLCSSSRAAQGCKKEPQHMFDRVHGPQHGKSQQNNICLPGGDWSTDQGKLAGLVSAIGNPTLVHFSNIRTMSKTDRLCTHAQNKSSHVTCQNQHELKQWRDKSKNAFTRLL